VVASRGPIFLGWTMTSAMVSRKRCSQPAVYALRAHAAVHVALLSLVLRCSAEVAERQAGSLDSPALCIAQHHMSTLAASRSTCRDATSKTARGTLGKGRGVEHSGRHFGEGTCCGDIMRHCGEASGVVVARCTVVSIYAAIALSHC
jgi:hypothetical protein